jgi:plastocyanin
MLAVALVLGFALAGTAACGQTAGGPGAGGSPKGGTGSAGSIPSQVALIGANGFQDQTITVTAGHGVDFVNLPQSPRLAVCLGQHGTCDTSAAGPDALQGGGLGLRNNESLTVAFNTPGTYHVTTVPMTAHDLTLVVH